jgi:hypothetical protein
MNSRGQQQLLLEPEPMPARRDANEPEPGESKTTVQSYLHSLTLEVQDGRPEPLWIAWTYALTDEGGQLERHASGAVDIRAVFTELVTEWRRDTALDSFVTHKVMHFAYQSIIGLGPAVVPLLLESLADDPRDWFWALAAIAREDPAEGIDNFHDAALAWLQWGASAKELPVAASA